MYKSTTYVVREERTPDTKGDYSSDEAEKCRKGRSIPRVHKIILVFGWNR
jgi:hypothetical protein